MATPRRDIPPSYLQPWKAQPGQESYYKIPAPYENQNPVWAWFLEPLFTALGLTHIQDPTYGRYTLPFSPREQKFRNDKRYTITEHRVWVHDEEDGSVGEYESDVLLGEEAGAKVAKVNGGVKEDGRKGKRWVWYQVWEDKEAMRTKGIEADLVFCHGINDYGGKFSEHAPVFLQAGYRLIIPDLPSHGRSTGLHAYVPSMDLLAEAVHAVIYDVALRDRLNDGPSASASATGTAGKQRKVFVAGQSMGGFTALFYCIRYPPSTRSPSNLTLPPDSPNKTTDTAIPSPPHPQISGALLLCPMLAISPDSRPSKFLEYIGKILVGVAGRLPFAEANRGKNSEDPRLEQEFSEDPQTYNGSLRIGTGIGILSGLLEVERRLPEIKFPFKVLHGTGDRVTNPEGSRKLFQQAASEDKEIQLYDGFEHVLLRKGDDEVDDKRRQRVLGDMLDWLNRHAQS